jgi:hypothetical protein
MEIMKKLRISFFSLIILTLIIYTFHSFLQETEARANILKTIHDFKTKHNIFGSLKHKTFSPMYKTDQDKRSFRNEVMLDLEYSKDLTRNLSLYLGPEIWVDNAHRAAGMLDEVNDREEERRYLVNLKEGYLSYYGNSFDLSLGKKIYAWGNANAFNPTDRLNSHDYFDVLDDEKMGGVSTALSVFSGNSTVDVVFVPNFIPSRLPDANNRWAGNPVNPVVTGGQFNINNSDVTGNMNPRQLPERTFENSQFGVIVKTTKEGWDFSLSYYDGFESVSAIRQEAGLIKTYTPVFNEISVVGGGFSTTFGDLEFNGELAQTFINGDNDDDYIQYISGGNYSWNDFTLFEKISVFLEYAGETVTSGKGDPDHLASQGYSRPFQNSLLGKVLFKFNEDTEVQCGGTYNMDDQDFYLQEKLTHKLSDELKLELGIDILTGNPNTFWGKWDKNDRVFTKLTYSF